MRMAVVEVGDMRMVMRQRSMLVLMRVKALDDDFVMIVVPIIMRMDMVVRTVLMRMEMRVPGSGDEDHSTDHEQRDETFPEPPWLAEERDRGQGPHERCRGEIGCFTSRADQPKRIGVQREAEAVTDRAQAEDGTDRWHVRPRHASHEGCDDHDCTRAQGLGFGHQQRIT